MKAFAIFIAISICISGTLAAWPVGVPTSLEGFRGYSLAQVKNTKTLLDPFIKFAATIVINFVNQKKFAPASYSFFMSYAYRKAVEGGYENRYYFRSYDPKNPTGYVYRGYFSVFWPSVTGQKAKLLNQIVESRVRRGQ